MCGFLSCIKSSDFIFPDFTNSKQILRRRGPDFQDEFYSDDFYCYHSRLSIIDLDNRSNQPFFSKCSRYLIIYNGEIYNLVNLREYLILNNVDLNTNSDTEVILELYLLEGDNFLSRLKGMFSFFIWDMQEKTGFAARDPYGIKPLYYYEKNGILIFSSQLKAIKAIFNDNNQFSSKALNDFYLLGSITESNTIFNGITCFKAGYKMSIKDNTIVNYSSWSNILEYWDDKNSANTKNLNKNHLPSFVNLQLVHSVKFHLVSDVKVGVFLSSGIDSSTIASLIKQCDHKNIQGINVVFEGAEIDESKGAQLIAKKYDIPLFVKTVSKDEFYADIDKIFESMDQPSIDGINTWYAAKAASECGLKVVLSGVGADELFYGYNYYRYMPIYMKIANVIFSNKKVNLLFYKILNFLSFVSSSKKILEIPNWMSNYFGAWLLKRSFLTPFEIGENYDASSNIYNCHKDLLDLSGSVKISDPKRALSFYDSFYYLRNQLLRDSDWASMYHGVELRTPFVDIDLLSNISPYMDHFKYFPKKQLLYMDLKYQLPVQITERKKTGFFIPIRKWLNEKFNLNTKKDYADFILDRYLKSLNFQ